MLLGPALNRRSGGVDIDTISGRLPILGEYGHTDGLRLFIRADDYMELRKLKDGDGRYLLQPDMSTGGIVVPR